MRATALPIPPNPTIPTVDPASSVTAASAAQYSGALHRPSRCALTATSRPRAKWSIIASTVSDIGAAWIPAELVKRTSRSSISGPSDVPTPAAPECTHSSPGAEVSTSGGIP